MMSLFIKAFCGLFVSQINQVYFMHFQGAPWSLKNYEETVTETAERKMRKNLSRM